MTSDQDDVHIISDVDKIYTLLCVLKDIAHRLRYIAMQTKEETTRTKLRDIALEIETGVEM